MAFIWYAYVVSMFAIRAHGLKSYVGVCLKTNEMIF